jgi:uncharacterized protein
MKVVLTFFALVLFISGKSRESNNYFAAMSFVKKEAILLRWAPVNYSLFERGLREGYSIVRINLLNERVPAEHDFSSEKAMHFNIKSPLGVADSLEKTGMEKRYSIMIRNFCNSKDPREKEYLYALMLLEAGVNREAAKSVGLFLEDSVMSSNITYAYRISFAGNPEYSIIFSVDPKLNDANPALANLAGKESGNSVFLQWSIPDLSSGYSGYWIEKSEDGKKFYNVNKHPYIFFKSQFEPGKTQADFGDTSVTEGMTYYYRIRGINHFGECGETSNIVCVYIRRKFQGTLQIDTIEIKEGKRIIKGICGNESDGSLIKSIDLYYSDSVNGNFSLAAQSLQTEKDFSMEDTIVRNRVYYTVRIITKDNDTITSHPYYFFYYDSIPPHAPANTFGVVLEDGMVKITWDRNREKDLRGYRVFRANSMSEEFTEVTKSFLKDPMYTEHLSLNTLERNIFYYVVSVDENYNNSFPSKIIRLQRPDTIPPVAAIITEIQQDTSGISLKWVNSPSVDVKESYLVRSGNESDTIVLRWKPSEKTMFKDSSIAPGSEFKYKIITRDSSENRSVSQVHSQFFETGTRKSVDRVTAIVNRESQSITLNWQTDKEEVWCIHIYRAKNDGNYKLIKTLRANPDEFTDNDLYINNCYNYRIQVVYRNGIRSEMSEEVVVEY